MQCNVKVTSFAVIPSQKNNQTTRFSGVGGLGSINAKLNERVEKNSPFFMHGCYMLF